MPDEVLTFGERMRRKRIGFLSRGQTRSSRVVDEGRLRDGQKFKVIQDGLGSRIRERSTEMGVSTGQDVKVNAPCLKGSLATREVRDAQP